MTQEILEKEKENLENYNQNLSTQLTQEKKKCKRMELTMKNDAKKLKQTNIPKEKSLPPKKHFAKYFDNLN